MKPMIEPAISTMKAKSVAGGIVDAHAARHRAGSGQPEHHTPASLYEAFEPAEARRIGERFEWHYSPKHGSWLNLAESALAVVSGQCLARRIPDAATLKSKVDAWRKRRNTHNARAKWHFTTADARVKLKSLYPAL